MQSVFDLCIPRDEVLKGELREDIFAARLKDVLDDKADPVYGDPVTFFENTYPTAGLKTLLNDALGRLIGKAAGKNAVIRLETAFGGGKTHNLIALYHVVSGNTPAKALSNILGKQTKLPQPGDIVIAGVVGSDLDQSVGIDHPEDKVKTYTLWGEIAYQLGGRAGYALAKESEENRSAPGTGLFEALVGDKPALIMLDEVARHLRAGLAVPTATKKSTLADQTVAFLMSLMEFAASKERCLVVLTLAGQADAFAKETDSLRQSLAEALKVSARQERVLTPTDEGEIPAIVTHRLFKSIDRKAAQPVLDAYAQYYRGLLEKSADLPQRAARAEYAREMQTAYPFHPELLTVLDRKTSTIPNFNRTRGALRLLAWTIRALWQSKPDGAWLIHPHHLDLAQSQIAEDLTSRLDRPLFKQVVEADIVSPKRGTLAHAQEVDQPLVASGKPPYARRLATTMFLHSLTQGIASGVDPADLMLAVLEPDESGGGDDPAVVSRALERLYDQAWFLEYDGHRYRFKTEPSLNKIIADETGHVGLSKAKAEIEDRIKQIWKKGYFRPVYFPVEPDDVDDDADLPKLAIMHFEAVKVGAAEAAPPDLVRRIYEYTGAMESFRTYQNNVLFLVADGDQVDNMVNVARRYLAIGRIVGDASRLAEFNDEQKKALKKMQESAELDVRVAITKAYRYLYYPTSDAPKSQAYLRRETLPAQDQGDVEKDQTNVVLRVLRALKKVLTADDDLLSAAYVKSKAWDQNQQSMTTDDLRKAFARKIGLRILLDIGQLRKTIQNGVQTGVWVYYDAGEQFGYDKDTPPQHWRIGEDAILYVPEEAARLQIRIKGKWQPPVEGGKTATSLATCPVCGRPEDQCICGVEVPGRRTIPAKLQGQGAVAQAFQKIVDECQEYGIARLRQVFIRIEGAGKQAAGELRAIGLAVPQFGKGRYGVELEVIAAFGSGANAESFRQEFKGGWDRYKRLKSVAESFGQEADELRVTMRVGAEFEDGLEVDGQQFQTIRDVLVTLGVGKVVIEAVPHVA
ncbi:MAG TPA: DUF499 domain-containing protein [Anaerolineae bacterium]|nr:DUF499 domain-containing protein [Anaerolineae bacterium]